MKRTTPALLLSTSSFRVVLSPSLVSTSPPKPSRLMVSPLAALTFLSEPLAATGFSFSTGSSTGFSGAALAGFPLTALLTFSVAFATLEEAFLGAGAGAGSGALRLRSSTGIASGGWVGGAGGSD